MTATNETEGSGKIRRFLCYIVENIDDFSFHTPQAMTLKRDLRNWYYGERNPERAVKLFQRLRGLFSGKMIWDQVGMLLWSVAEPSPALSSFQFKQLFSQIPHGGVTGKTLYAYGAWQNEAQFFCRLNEQREEVERTAAAALEKLDSLYQQERAWYRKNGVTWFGLLTVFTGVFALFLGLLWICQTIPALWQGGLNAAAYRQPIYTYLGQNITLVLMGLCLLDTLFCLTLIPHFLMTLYTALLWFFVLRRHTRRRATRIAQIRALLTGGGLKEYCKQLQRAAHVLTDLPSDAPKNADPSRNLLNGYRFGMREWKKLPMPLGKKLELLCQTLERWHLRFQEKVVLGSGCVLIVLLTVLHCGIPL